MPDALLGNHERRVGKVVVIGGPDGTGKSTLADGLVARIAAQGHPVRHFHHRLRVLPASAASAVATSEPHGQPPYSHAISFAKIGYLFANEMLGWAFRVRPFARDGGWTVVERGWWDLAIDPRRYRLAAGGRLIRILGRLLPQPDLVVILDVPEDEVARRKAELELTELRRQLAEWREVARLIRRALVVDAARPADKVLDLVATSLGVGHRIA